VKTDKLQNVQVRNHSQTIRIPRVIIESRFETSLQFDLKSNEKLAKAACQHAILMGYNPFASHLFFPRFLDDANPGERALGIDLGLMWGKGADEIWFCFRTTDYEYSEGMKIARDYHAGAPVVREMFFEENNGGFEFKKGAILQWRK
jgi:hypothetical protein